MENTNTNQRKKVLVGDDQIGVVGSLQQKAFLMNYSGLAQLADFEFESVAEDFVKKAKETRYDALLIDLNWKEEDSHCDNKTGFRVLDQVKSDSPIRILHTSDDRNRQGGYQHGATHCLEKHRSSRYLEMILKGGCENDI